MAMFEGLALSLLGSVPLSYMLMKGLRCTSRALRDLDGMQDDDMGASGGTKWRKVSGRRVTGGIGSGGRRSGMGRCSAGRSRTARRGFSRGDGFRRAATREGDSPGTGQRGEGNGDMTGRRGTKGSDGINGGRKNGDPKMMNSGETGVCDSQRSVPGDVAGGESPIVNKSSAGMKMVKGISKQLNKPLNGFMKSVRMATGVVSGVTSATGVIHYIQTPAEGLIMGVGAANGVVLGIQIARVFIKGAKVLKDITGVGIKMGVNKVVLDAAVRDKFFKGVKASDGALTLLRLTKDFAIGVGDTFQSGFSHYDIASKGYDALNSMIKVFEAVLGVKGGGMVGFVGSGFTSLKGAASTLGVSTKIREAVVVSKEVTIFMLKGFGVSKTMKAAFKALKDGEKMVKWLIFKDGVMSKEDFLKVISLQNIQHKFELLLISVHRSAYRRRRQSSLMFSLASLLLAASLVSRVGDNNEDAGTLISVCPSCIFSLALPT